ncbi:uncharacterized mitochondrial protein AtMg00810-like [Gossypium hirsutum]|uniref:Uncharacterized mitochondrial protein AtMg00810-like n=1 Tax=Gossypium hirsutum TaxID=3635 RepID=A0A1U8KX79_GOSHI|nr:uncharacterized mitochondrial protein AtMg00810-like [Gossypium hirsutum]
MAIKVDVKNAFLSGDLQEEIYMDPPHWYFHSIKCANFNVFCMAKYASDLLSRANIIDCKTVPTPLEPNVKLNLLDDIPLSNPTLYRTLVGSLVYLIMTRPDIAHAVHMVGQFLTSPRSSHFLAVLRILRYVKGLLFYSLHFFAHSSLVLAEYFGVDWAEEPNNGLMFLSLYSNDLVDGGTKFIRIDFPN